MKPNKDEFNAIDEDWIHTEVLNRKGGRSGGFSNLIIGGVAVLIVILVVLAFTNLFQKDDLANLENLDAIKKDQSSSLADAGALEQKRAEEEAKKAAEEAAKAEASNITYVVKAGDTLAGIGAEYGVEYTKIAEANDLKEPFALEVGQELIIPGVKKTEEPKTEASAAQPTNTGVADSGQTYTVKAGDTLAGIGLTLGVDWEQMAKLNGLTEPYELEIDQILKVPAQ